MTFKKPTDMLGGLTSGLPLKDWPSADWTALMRPQTRVAEAMLRHNIEALDFLKARLERDRDFLGTLAKAETPSEAIGLWQGFWQKMIADYATETDKLAASAASLAEETIRSATDEGAALIGAKGKAE